MARNDQTAYYKAPPPVIEPGHTFDSITSKISSIVLTKHQPIPWIVTTFIGFIFVNVLLVAVSYLFNHTLRRDVLTMDKLYGAAATFLMLGVLWGYFYLILLWFYPGALTINGELMSAPPRSTILYFSFVTLTSTGMSDVMPVHPIARMLCVFEMITGVLFITVLIARLAGGYPPPERQK